MDMTLKRGSIYLPKNRNNKPVKYLCICAHQDDNEIMAMDGVLKGIRSRNYSFALVVTADGGGSARTGEFKDYTDEMMKAVRIKEQQEASEMGRYHSLYLFNVIKIFGKAQILLSVKFFANHTDQTKASTASCIA